MTHHPLTMTTSYWVGVCSPEEWIESAMKSLMISLGRRVSAQTIVKEFATLTRNEKRYKALIIDYLKNNTTQEMDEDGTLFFMINDEVVDGKDDTLAQEIEKALEDD